MNWIRGGFELVTKTVASVAGLRKEAAKRIRELSEGWAKNTIELGLEFKKARDSFPVADAPASGARKPRPGWAEWVKDNTSWSVKHATSFIRVAEKFGNKKLPKGASHTLLVYLSQEEVPEEARKEIVERADKGEAITRDRAKKIVDELKLPSAAEANKQAKETGKPVLGKGGYYYFGASKQDAAEYEKQLDIVYGVRRAVETLSGMKMSPASFLKYAERHQVWSGKEELDSLDRAKDWLNGLVESMEEYV